MEENKKNYKKNNIKKSFEKIGNRIENKDDFKDKKNNETINNLEEPLWFAMDDYLFSINYNLVQLKKRSKLPGFNQTIVEIKRKKKSAVKKYKKLNIPIKDHEWIYLLIYPIRTKVYLHLRSFFKKIKKIVKK